MDSQMKDVAWLAWIEQLAVAPASQGRENELPRSLFHCRLDDQPDHLVPVRLLRPEYWEGLSDRPFFLNPTCLFAPNGELPAGVPTTGFAHQGQIAWITDPGNGAQQPFWLGPELCAMLARSQPGDPAPSTLSPQARSALIMANLLVPHDYASRRRQQWDDVVAVTGAQYQSQGYAPVGRLIHPFHIAALRRYYRHQIRTGKLHLGDVQCSLRYNVYNDPVARFFHQQLTPAMTAFAGKPLKASYVFLACYQPGAILEKHTDREQCDFSVTLCLDYTPEPRNATPWPIHLQKQSGKVTAFQAIGDALLYRGCQLPHWRDPLPEGHTSTSIFFHYVREDFKGSLL
jgi:hypothetical protein